jgi:hypothetical protein
LLILPPACALFPVATLKLLLPLAFARSPVATLTLPSVPLAFAKFPVAVLALPSPLAFAPLPKAEFATTPVPLALAFVPQATLLAPPAAVAPAPVPGGIVKPVALPRQTNCALRLRRAGCTPAQSPARCRATKSKTTGYHA